MYPGYTMVLPSIVIRVRLGSDFCGSTSQTTLLKDIYFRLLTGMFSHLITKKVSEPATRFSWGRLYLFRRLCIDVQVSFCTISSTPFLVLGGYTVGAN